METILNNGYACEKFASVYEFMNVISSRKSNKVFAGHPLASQMVSDDGWSGTRTWDDSVRIFKNGYADGMEAITRGFRIQTSEVLQPRMVESIVGAAPNLPNYIKGLPTNMWHRPRNHKRDIQTCNVFYDRCASYKISTKELTRASHLALVAVRHLEAHGMHIGLHVMYTVYSPHQTICPVVKIKEALSPLNPLKVAYPMVHPAFFRRQIFRWEETSPVVTDDDYLDGYGTCYYAKFRTIDDRRSDLIDHGIIGPRDIYLDQSFMKGIFDADSLIDYINRTYSASAE